MVSKNSEARKCANTNRASMSVTVCKETNMSIVTKSDLNFQGIHLQPVENIDETWLTASQIGYALQYADDKAVQRIYSRHADEFTEKMTGVVKVTTPYGDQMTRAFSLRGAHLIAMFARTPKAKEFRRWVLDILDGEVTHGGVKVAFDFEMHAHNAGVAYKYLGCIYQAWKDQLKPALRAVGSPLAVELEGRIKDLCAITYGLSSALNKKASKGEIH